MFTCQILYFVIYVSNILFCHLHVKKYILFDKIIFEIINDNIVCYFKLSNQKNMGKVAAEKRLNEIVEELNFIEKESEEYKWMVEFTCHNIAIYMSERHFYCLRVKIFVFVIFRSIIVFIIKGIKITDKFEFIYMYFIFFLQNLEKLLRKTIYAY